MKLCKIGLALLTVVVGLCVFDMVSTGDKTAILYDKVFALLAGLGGMAGLVWLLRDRRRKQDDALAGTTLSVPPDESPHAKPGSEEEEPDPISEGTTPYSPAAAVPGEQEKPSELRGQVERDPEPAAHDPALESARPRPVEPVPPAPVPPLADQASTSLLGATGNTCSNCGGELFATDRACRRCFTQIPGLEGETPAPEPDSSSPVEPLLPTPVFPLEAHLADKAAKSQASKNCPYCGEEILAVAVKCKHCGSDLSSGGTTAKRSESTGQLALVLPACSAFLAYFWIGSMPLIFGPGHKLVWLMAVTVILTASLIAIEADAVGAGSEKDVTKKGRRREGPITWFFFGLLLWAVAFPLWMYRRQSYGLKNFCVVSIFVLLFFVGITGLLSMALDKQEAEVRQQLNSIQSRMEQVQRDLGHSGY